MVQKIRYDEECMSDLRVVIRQNWRKMMPLRAARPRGVRRRPRDDAKMVALRVLAERVARRAFRSWLIQEGPRRYRLLSRRSP